MGLRDQNTLRAGAVRLTASNSGVKGVHITKRTGALFPGTGPRHDEAAAGAAANSTPLPGRHSSAPPDLALTGTSPLVFKGYLATVTLWPGRVQIDRTFLGRINGNYSVSIPWQRVTRVNFLDPARVVNGHVHFAIDSDPRGLTANSRSRWLGRAARNPHAIMFTWRQRATYERLRGLLTARS